MGCLIMLIHSKMYYIIHICNTWAYLIMVWWMLTLKVFRYHTNGIPFTNVINLKKKTIDATLDNFHPPWIWVMLSSNGSERVYFSYKSVIDINFLYSNHFANKTKKVSKLFWSYIIFVQAIAVARLVGKSVRLAYGRLVFKSRPQLTDR